MFVKAMVLTGQGPDRVFITTDKPNAFSMINEPLVISFEATKGTGEIYIKEHFGLSAEIIDRGGNLKPFRD